MVTRRFQDDPLLPRADRSANGRSVRSRQANVAIGEDLDNDFARSDMRVKVRNRGARMIAGKHVKSDLPHPRAAHTI